MTYAVDSHYGEAIGYGMSALHGDPGFALPGLLLRSVGTFEADGCGVDEDFSAGESHDACGFWIPLVPAYEYAETAYRGIDRFEAEVARGEVELLVICGVVGYVHLAVFTGYGAVAVKDDGCVVVESGSAALEYGGDDDHFQLGGEKAVSADSLVIEGKSEVTFVDILGLAEVERIVQAPD